MQAYRPHQTRQATGAASLTAESQGPERRWLSNPDVAKTIAEQGSVPRDGEEFADFYEALMAKVDAREQAQEEHSRLFELVAQWPQATGKKCQEGMVMPSTIITELMTELALDFPGVAYVLGTTVNKVARYLAPSNPEGILLCDQIMRSGENLSLRAIMDRTGLWDHAVERHAKRLGYLSPIMANEGMKKWPIEARHRAEKLHDEGLGPRAIHTELLRVNPELAELPYKTVCKWLATKRKRSTK